MARTKIIFDNPAHVWITQTQDYGKNKQGNFYFHGDTIYSYGSHFPIARIITLGKGTKARRVVLFTTATYSHTTSGHISATRGAIRGNIIPVFDVPKVDVYRGSDHKTNMADYQSRIEDFTEQASKSRKYTASLLESAAALYKEAVTYKKTFRIRGKMFALPKAENLERERIEKLRQQVFQAIESAAEKIKAQRIQAKKQEQIRQAENLERERIEKLRQQVFQDTIIPAWRTNTKTVKVDNLDGKGLDDVDVNQVMKNRAYTLDFALLRIKKATKTGNTVIVETSKQVEMVAKKSGKILPWVTTLIDLCRNCIATKTAYTIPPDNPVTIGDTWQLRSISDNGTVTIGCHVIEFSEIEAIYNRLLS